MLKKILRAAAAGAAFVVVYLVCLYAVQDYLIFYPDRFYAGPSSAGAPAFEERPLVTADGHLIMAWYAKGDADKPAILFFHGNAGQLATFAPHLKAYIDAGYPVFMPEYRGFGLSGGKLSEETMYADAVVAFNYLKDRLGHDKIVVFGYSMGTAAASAAAGMCSADALILAAPFYSLEREVGDKPVPLARLVLKNRLQSNRFIAAYPGPLLVVHGSEDKLICLTTAGNFLSCRRLRTRNSFWRRGLITTVCFLTMATIGRCSTGWTGVLAPAADGGADKCPPAAAGLILAP